ncbi:leucine Rich repeat-containing domain protein, partial [Ancylostoma caninum]
IDFIEFQLCSLELLELADNRIGKIENLEELTTLKKLFLGANQITTIEGLSTLKELTVLSFIGNAIRDIEGLGTLTKLTDLAVSQNGLTRIAGLTNNLELTTLDLNDNRIEKIENLQHLTNLKALWIRNNRVRFESLIFKRSKMATNHRIQIANWSEVAYLNRLPSLKNVAFEMNPIYSSQHFYRNRIREILPRVRIIDGFPANWISGDPWQALSEGSEGSCV